MNPVVLFVYNRPAHTLQTLQALVCNEGAGDTCLFIFSDGPKSVDDDTAVLEVRQICRAVKGFKQVEIVERPVNMGLAANVIEGVTQVLLEFESVVVLEDDLETSPGFLPFMNQALAFYHKSNVFSISGYSPGIKIPVGYHFTTYLAPRIGSWGWATWRHRWESVDWEVKDFDSFFRNGETRKAFEAGGNDLPTMLMKQKAGLINSWAVRFEYARFQARALTVYPVVSLVKNLGADGSGTHMSRSKKYLSPTVDFINADRFSPPDYTEAKLARHFKHFYNTSWFRCGINFFKRINYWLK